jgi:hypothetical protein
MLLEAGGTLQKKSETMHDTVYREVAISKVMS